MKQENYTIVDGFLLPKGPIADKAIREKDGVKYLKERLDRSNPENVLALYQRLRMEKTFETPVGYEYLRELQEYLLTIPFMKKEDIPSLDLTPMFSLYQSCQKEFQQEQIKIGNQKYKEDKKRQEKKEKSDKKKQKQEKKELAAKEPGKDREHFVMSLILNGILIVGIGVMFWISSTSDSTTIVNYETKIINKYEAWEKELDQREEKIKEYEEKYQINP